MSTPNPFIQRNLPLSELIARQRRVQASQEGAGPTTNYMNRRELGQIGEAIDRYGRPMPQMQRPMQPRPMAPQPAPRPMQPRPMSPQPAPMPMQPRPMPAPIMSGTSPAGGGGMAGQVSVTGGGVSPPQPQGPWAGMNMGGMGMGAGMGLPPVMGGGGVPYGGYQNFNGFGPQQPYRSAGGFGFQRAF